MKAKELAKKLLSRPDAEVMVFDNREDEIVDIKKVHYVRDESYYDVEYFIIRVTP